ncbi:hypothetical protein VCHC46B1_3463 [Vibrio cholerae HC-46B1]|nr:hypothetical protein VCHC41B1_3002 [Vibrio cholerae HC-41B1]EKL95332.1 hypothetical protein VCHC46B1_3463 [Vibrio cholerae HC-46B1]EKM02437.1 hypothetical protein VCHC44C1_3043 [Vibrio cholerae HC-44C1]EMP90890.1 hypothetical protein VC87395_003042 [Vibrio paracholerae 87395]
MGAVNNPHHFASHALGNKGKIIIPIPSQVSESSISANQNAPKAATKINPEYSASAI